jgi:hypothetical protein
MSDQPPHRTTTPRATLAFAGIALLHLGGCGGQYADQGTVDLEASVKAADDEWARRSSTSVMA